MPTKPHRAVPLLALALGLALVVPAYAGPDHEPDHGLDNGLDNGLDAGHDPTVPREVPDPAAALEFMDQFGLDVISGGPFAKVTKNLQLRGRGERLEPGATTDVWALDGFAYTGTFNDPCGGEEGAGVWIWDVRNRNRPSFVGILESEVGSRSNDVKVAAMNSGDILVHSNENCGPEGMGGFEIYNVDDPREPEHLATVRVHEANETLRTLFGGVNRGVHNLFLFAQDDRDLVALQTHAWFGGLQIFDITDPTDSQLVTEWGAELLCDEPFCSDDPYNETDIPTLIAHINGYMFCDLVPCFGFSQNRFLHDVTVSEDGTLAYLSHWDAGLILLDISDSADPVFISQALEPEAGSLDGEVNSHAAWPSEDGTIVVETEEDFDAWTVTPIANWTVFEETWNTIPAVSISTVAGDDFEANPTGNGVRISLEDGLEVLVGPLAPNIYAISEAAGNQPKLADTGPLEAEAVYVGRGCDTDNFGVEDVDTPGIVDEHLHDPDGKIAVVRRGACTFSSKLGAAQEAGAIAVVVADDRPSTPWGGVRIWDYTDPENPVLASTFNTECSAAPEPIPGCDPFGVYTVHNVVVETTGNRVKAYLSWYYDGMLVLDVTDPYNPVEVARYFDNSPEFIEANGGQPHDFWGVWKEPRSPWIYGSDRNGGLYVFREQGAGSGR